MLEHVFAPFLECCGDAVMFAKQNAALDDEDDVTAMKIVRLLMKLRLWLQNEISLDDFGKFSRFCCFHLFLFND